MIVALKKIREGIWSSVWGSSEGMDMVGERIGRRGGDSSMDVMGRMIAFSCECKHMLNRGLMYRERNPYFELWDIDRSRLNERTVVTAVAVFVAGVDRSQV